MNKAGKLFENATNKKKAQLAEDCLAVHYANLTEDVQLIEFCFPHWHCAQLTVLVAGHAV